MTKALKVFLVLLLLPVLIGCSKAPGSGVQEKLLAPEEPETLLEMPESIQENRAPEMVFPDSQEINEGSLLEFSVTATDPDGDGVILSVENLPESAAFNAITGKFSWTPDEAGNYSFDFTASDGSLNSSASVDVVVKPVNHAPEVQPVGDKQVTMGMPLEFTVTATDPDGGVIKLSAENLPAGATFDPASGKFTWSPGEIGSYTGLKFTASDSKLSASETIDITVSEVELPNRTPELREIGSKRVRKGAVLKFKISATDPDSDTITYSATNLPAGATLDPATGQFIWKAGDPGTLQGIQFTASDGELTDSETITITVTRPPEEDDCSV